MLDKKLIDLLKPLKIKYFFKRLIYNLTLALVLWSSISVIIMVTSRFTPITFVWSKLLLILVFTLFIGSMWTIYKRPSYRETAFLVDSFDMKERVSTSLELKGQEEISARLQKEDTIALLKEKDLRSKILLKPSMKLVLFIFILLVATISINLVPTNSYVLAKEKEKNLEKLDEEKANIEKLQDNIEKSEELTLEEKKKIEADLKEIKKKLKKSKDIKDIKKDIVKAKKELSEIKEDIKEDKLNEIAKNLKGNEFTKELSKKLKNSSDNELANTIEDMVKKIENLNKEELKKLKQELDALQDIFKNNTELQNAFKEIKDAVAQAIKEGSINSSIINQSLQNLSQAINNQLNNSEIANELDEALNSLDELNNVLSQMDEDINKNGTKNNSQATNNNNMNNKNSGNQGNKGNQNNGSGASGSGNKSEAGNQGNGAGNGSTQENGSNEGKTQGLGGKSKESSGKEAQDYEKIFTPNRLDARGEKSNIHGNINNRGEKDTIEVKKFGEAMGEVIPFSEVLKTYKEGEFNRINQEEIPVNMKELVKEYFIKLDE